MAEGAVWSVGVGFIMLGLLNFAVSSWGPWNWVIAGVVALLVGLYGPQLMK